MLCVKPQVIGPPWTPTGKFVSFFQLFKETPSLTRSFKLIKMTQAEEINYDLERGLLQHLLQNKETLQNKPDLIIKEMHSFGIEHKLECLNSFKVQQIVKQIQEIKPEIVVQFGTHGGYSSLLIANELKKINGSTSTVKVFTFEVDPVFQNISSQIIKLSGLQDFIFPVFGKSGSSIQTLVENHLVERIDFLLLDHWKDCYLPDLRVVETLSLITKGSVIFADNAISGAPDYLEYVKSPPSFKRTYNSKIRNVNGSLYLGKWGLIYDSETILNKETKNQGIELTTCIGVLDG